MLWSLVEPRLFFPAFLRPAASCRPQDGLRPPPQDLAGKFCFGFPDGTLLDCLCFLNRLVGSSGRGGVVTRHFVSYRQESAKLRGATCLTQHWELPAVCTMIQRITFCRVQYTIVQIRLLADERDCYA